MSIGFNPHYGNSEKTAEPWLLHTFEQVRAPGPAAAPCPAGSLGHGPASPAHLRCPPAAQPFYDESIRLVVCGYVRPEAAFTSLAALVERIHHDAAVSRRALELQPLAGFAADPFLGAGGCS
jgi:riboflavin kinase